MVSQQSSSFYEELHKLDLDDAKAAIVVITHVLFSGEDGSFRKYAQDHNLMNVDFISKNIGTS